MNPNQALWEKGTSLALPRPCARAVKRNGKRAAVGSTGFNLLGSAPDFYAKPRAEIFDLETQLKTARDKVAHLYARWHELELLQSVPPS